VRVIRYTVAHRGFRSQSVTLVTTLLDPDIADSDFADLYFRRWLVELHFREIKTCLHMDILRRVSLNGALDTLRQFAKATVDPEDKPRIVSALGGAMLLAIARDLVPLRPGRTEPRVIKRSPKNYRLLTKPLREMRPLPHRKISVENPSKSALS